MAKIMNLFLKQNPFLRSCFGFICHDFYKGFSVRVFLAFEKDSRTIWPENPEKTKQLLIFAAPNFGPGPQYDRQWQHHAREPGRESFQEMTAMKKSKKFNQYKADNEAFLAGKAAEEGVLALDNGVVIRKLEQGRGKVHPAPGSVVYVNYTGRLMDGTVFDSTDGQALPALFRVRDLIMGWQIALVRMHEGDKFRIWIPAKYAYGSAKMDMIPAWSTLEFDIELVKIAQI